MCIMCRGAFNIRSMGGAKVRQMIYESRGKGFGWNWGRQPQEAVGRDICALVGASIIIQGCATTWVVFVCRYFRLWMIAIVMIIYSNISKFRYLKSCFFRENTFSPQNNIDTSDPEKGNNKAVDPRGNVSTMRTLCQTKDIISNHPTCKRINIAPSACNAQLLYFEYSISD